MYIYDNYNVPNPCPEDRKIFTSNLYFYMHVYLSLFFAQLHVLQLYFMACVLHIECDK